MFQLNAHITKLYSEMVNANHVMLDSILIKCKEHARSKFAENIKSWPMKETDVKIACLTLDHNQEESIVPQTIAQMVSLNLMELA